MALPYISTAVYTPPPSLAPFSAPLQTFQESYDCETSLVVGGFIFSLGRASLPDGTNNALTSSKDIRATREPRLLMLQRASADTYGDLWDFPGGSCEASDATLLDAVKREVWEETGLCVTEVVEFVGLHTWVEDLKKGNRKGAKFSFIVAVEEEGSNEEVSRGEGEREGSFPRVRLDEREHQAFKWVTEGDIEASLEDREGALKFIAMEEMEIAMEAFRRFRLSLQSKKH